MWLSVLVAVSLVQTGEQEVAVEGEIPFLRSWQAAFERSRQIGKPVLAYFTFHG